VEPPLRRLLAVVALAALTTAGCGPTQATPTPRDLVLTGTSQFIGLGTTSQWTVRQRLTNWAETDMPGPPEWTSSDPKVASVSRDGVVTSASFGTTVISVTYKTLSARKSVLVSPKTPVGLGVLTDLTFTAAGQNRQLTAVVRSDDDSTVDVTADAQWTSSDSSIALISASGVLTTTGYGTATITVRYGALTFGEGMSVLPSGGFIVTGRVRLPGNGGGGEHLGVPGFTVTNTDLGFSVVSDTQGRYGIAAANGMRLTFEKAGFETTELIVSSATFDQPVQQLIRLTAGDTATTTIFENDVAYDPSPAFHCENCRLIRVVSPAAGTLHVQVDWPSSFASPVLWANGRTFNATAARQLIADVPVDAGESVLYIQAGSGIFATLTVKTSLQPAPGGGLWE